MKKQGVELDDVSFKTFLFFEEDKFGYYYKIGKAMKPDPTGLPDIVDWSFGKVKELQMNFTEGITLDAIPKLLAFSYSTKDDDRSPDEFWEMKWHQVFRCWNHIYNQVQSIVTRERVLAYEPDADEEEAGIQRFARFGSMATIDVLADGNVLLYDEIEAKPYRLIFAKLYLESEKKRYQKAMHAIRGRRK